MHQVHRVTVPYPQAQHGVNDQIHRATVAYFPQQSPQTEQRQQVEQRASGQVTFGKAQSWSPQVSDAQPAQAFSQFAQAPVNQPAPVLQFAQVPVNQPVPVKGKGKGDRAPSYRELQTRLDDAEAEAKHWVLEVQAKVDEANILKEELQEGQKKVAALKKQESTLRTELEDLQNEGKRFWANHELEVKENIDALTAATNAAERLQEQVSEFEVADAELAAECRELDREAEVLSSEVAGIKKEKLILLEEAAEADSVMDGLTAQFEERARHLEVITAATQREQVERQFLSELLSATRARIEAARSELESQEEMNNEEAVNGWQTWQASCSNGAGEVEALRCELQLAHELLRRRTEERDNWRKVAYQSELHFRAERGDDVVQSLKQLTASCSFRGAAAGADKEPSVSRGRTDNARAILDATLSAGHQPGFANSGIDRPGHQAGFANAGNVVDHMSNAGVHGAGHVPWQLPNAGHIVHGDVPEFVTPPPNLQPELPLLALPPLPQMDWPPAGPDARGQQQHMFPGFQVKM